MRAERKVERVRSRRLDRARCTDAGYSLSEVVVAVALMGIAVIPIMLAGIVSVRASAQTRTAAKVETVVGNAADRVNRAGESCNYDVYVQAAALSQGWSATSATAQYQWYEPAATPASLGTWQPGACPGGVRPAGLVQKVTITVVSPDGKLTRTMQVVKSDV